MLSPLVPDRGTDVWLKTFFLMPGIWLIQWTVIRQALGYSFVVCLLIASLRPGVRFGAAR